MARIAGVNLPKNKRVEIGLTYIYGIGPTTAKRIMEQSQIDTTTRVKDLSETQETKLRGIIEKEFKVEGELKREILMNIKRLKEVNSYRGSRHAKHLPARGQSTKSNSRTVRGNTRKTMGSGRKPTAQKT